MNPSAPPTTRLRDDQLFLALSIVVGVLCGLVAVLFALGIDRLSRALFGPEPSFARLLTCQPASGSSPARC